MSEVWSGWTKCDPLLLNTLNNLQQEVFEMSFISTQTITVSSPVFVWMNRCNKFTGILKKRNKVKNEFNILENE